MASETPGDHDDMFDPTLNGVMAQIEAGKIVLPAMQRPFVWKDDRITKLIDSMLRGFPLGTALLWKTATMQRWRFQRRSPTRASQSTSTATTRASGTWSSMDSSDSRVSSSRSPAPTTARSCSWTC
ncbi:MAG: DUF262 domain-containing protein [Deltaproteobacteria bacterium]|nr:DUF262 domain-containing protein [Deltaproteobacteria bacterium]